MLNAVGGADGIRTRIQVLPDGSTVMLKTRNGMPEFVRTPKKTKIAEGVELVFYCRLIDQTHPLGVAYNSAVNADYTIPTYPVSKGAITSATLAAEADPTLTDSPGPMRWVDSRPTKVVSETLTWASVIGQWRSQRAAMFSPYITPYCYDDNVETVGVTNPYGSSMSFTAGAGYPGQQFSTYPSNNYVTQTYGARMRFAGVSGYTTKLFIDGVNSGISGKIAAAAISLAPDKHIKVVVLPNYGGGGWNTACAMTIKHYAMGGTAHPTLPDVPVTFPAGINALVNIQHGPAFNSSATKFVVAGLIPTEGYTVPLGQLELAFRVFECDVSTGALTVVDTPFDSASTITSNPSGGRLYTETGVLSETWTSETNRETYGLLGAGYNGDTLQLLVHKNTDNSVLEKVINLHADPPSPGTTQTVHTRVDTTTYSVTNEVYLHPAGTTLYTETKSGSTEVDYAETVNYAYVNSAWTHIDSTHTKATTQVGPTYADAAITDVYSAFADFAAGVFCFAIVGRTTTTTADTETIYTRSGAAEFYTSTGYSAYSNTEARSARVIFCGGSSPTTIDLGTCESTTTDYAESAGGGIMPSYEWLRYLYLPANYSSAEDGFSISRDGDFYCIDGFSFAVDQDAKKCVISILHGDNFDTSTYDPYDEYGSHPFSQMAVTNLIGTKTNNSWTFLPLTLPAYVGNLAWMSEPTFIKVKK